VQLDGRAAQEGWRSLGQREERLAFLHDMGGEFRCAAAAGIPHRMDRPAGTVKASPALNVLAGWPSI
jgi:hypothetical protein